MGMMRRLGLGAAFCAGAVLCMAAAYALSEAVDPVFPEMRAKIAMFRQRSPSLQAVSVGNSHTRALDFGALGVEGMHLYEGGQDVFEAAYLAQYAVERAPRLRYVLMTTSYGLERLDHAAMTSEDLSGIRRRTYARTAIPRFIPGDGALWLSAVFSPISRSDHWSGVALRLLRPGHPREPVRLTRDGRAQEPPPPPFVPDPAARDRPPRPTGHPAGADESVVNDPTTPARAVARLEKLARSLEARGIRMVLYTPPYHETYPRYMTRRAPATRQALAPLLKHSNVVWMDFGQDPAFIRRVELFRDSDHMNPEGARVFSAHLRRCLAALPAQGDAALPAECRRVR
ncbi:MAG TPA: hypothetical protein VGC13_23535 [Longimicrobium sp.]|jgi:hypothetical protein